MAAQKQEGPRVALAVRRPITVLPQGQKAEYKRILQ